MSKSITHAPTLMKDLELSEKDKEALRSLTCQNCAAKDAEIKKLNDKNFELQGIAANRADCIEEMKAEIEGLKEEHNVLEMLRELETFFRNHYPVAFDAWKGD